MKSVGVRSELTDDLKLDLVGPSERLDVPTEVLPQAPSRWYLTGFLVPLDAEQSQKVDEDCTDAIDAVSDGGGADDATTLDLSKGSHHKRAGTGGGPGDRFCGCKDVDPGTASSKNTREAEQVGLRTQLVIREHNPGLELAGDRNPDCPRSHDDRQAATLAFAF